MSENLPASCEGDGGSGGGGDEECEDVEGWHDSDGNDCKWYTEDDNCDDHGSRHENDGHTANEACCVCGGGITGGDGGDDGGGDEECEDVKGWHDSEGKDCEWYEEDDNCDDHGLQHENDGHTANKACCVCGGSITGGDSGDDGGGDEECQDVPKWHDSGQVLPSRRQ